MDRTLLRVLLVEDSEDDAKIALRHLGRGGFEVRHHERVHSAAALEAALARGPWDAVIADYRMPGFTGLQALEIVRSAGLDIPFLLLSGTIGEEPAVEAMKAGASDYVMKRDLSRLAPALARELKEAANRAAGRRAERERAASELRLRTIIATEPECVKVVGAEGRLLEMNPAGLAMLEAGALAEVQARPLLDFIALPHRPAFVRLHQHVMRGESATLEFEAIGLRGGRRWLETHAAPLRDAAGAVSALLGITRDVTERKRAEEALRAREAELHAIFDQAGVGIARIGADRRIQRANRRLGALLGAPAHELAGRTLAELSHPEDREALTRERERLYAGGIAQAAGEKRYLRPDGSTLWARVTISLARDAGGAPEYEIAVFEDITAERRARAKMGRLRAALEMSFDAVYVVSRRDMRIVDTNEAACRMLGYAREELIGASPAILFADASLTDARLAAEYDAVPRDPGAHTTHESVHRRKDGAEVPVEIQRGVATIRGTQYLVAIVRDISARRSAERALRESEERHRTLVERSPDAIFVTDSGRIAFANESAARLFRVPRAGDLIGRPVLERIHPDSRGLVERRLRALEEGAQAQPLVEQKYLRLDGTPVEVEVMSARFTLEGRPALQVVARDISERKRAERLLALEHAVTRVLAEAGTAAAGVEATIRAVCEAEDWEAGRYFRADEPAGLLQAVAYWSRPGGGFAGFEAKSRGLSFARGTGIAGRVWESGEPIWVPDVGRDARIVNAALAAESGIRSAFVFPVAAEGRTVGVLGTFSRELREPDARLLAAIHVIGSQLGQFLRRKDAEERVAHLAQFDALTGLPNRALLRDRLEQAIAQAHRNDWQVAALALDIDQFKWVNDTLGHAAGDELLKQAGRRLQGCLRAGDTVARLGGDEFALVLPDLESPEAAAAVAQKLLEALKAPFAIAGHEAFVGASIGLTLYPSDGGATETLLRNADTAMYRAKQAGRNRFQFFTPEMNAESERRLAIEADLRHALERGEFELHYQPKSAASGTPLTGAEALLRWRRAGGALVPPAEFIPVLEDTGLIAEVGDWVIAEACRQHARWARAGLAGVCVAVNVSARQFRDGALVESVRRSLAESGCPPSCLELEITESLVMQDVEVTIEALEALREMGVRVAIDDFGTGYSSLAYLKRLPVDTLKIDRSFVKDVTEDPNDATIVTAIISMARNFGFRVVAEGVETPLQRQFLEAFGCHEIQGYLLSRPLPAEEFARWAAEREFIDCRRKRAA